MTNYLTETALPVLELKGIIKDYPGVRAVNQASLALLRGEVHGLVGENGAGKSTLIKIMAGAVHPDAGSISINGQEVVIASGSQAHQIGLSFIHQELSLVSYLSGAENIFLGHDYPRNRLGLIDWGELNRRAAAILSRLGVELPVNRTVSSLSRGDQSMISIARAFAKDAQIYVMDEPTASLTDDEIRSLFNVIRLLRSEGKTVLYVTHRLEEIFEICDRVTVMRDGSVVATRQVDAIGQAEMIRMMIGRSLSESIPPALSEPGTPVLEIRGLSGGRVRDISFAVRSGEVLGFAGLVGAGRSEILRMLYAADPLVSGEMELDGSDYHPHSPADAIRAGVVLVPEERRSQGLILSRSIQENISLPHLSRLARGAFFLNWKKETALSRRTSQAVRLKAVSPQQIAAQLSGGNQQKVVFARWLAEDVRVLLLDEPTRGVDVGARFEIYRIIRDLAERGAAVLLVSSDLPELLGLADRVIVMREGRQTAELAKEDLTQERVLRYCYGEEQ